jgi:hypothetical protein
MLFHLTTEDDIRVIHEQGPAETDAGGSTFASEQAFNNLAGEWPMKRLIEIWNRLPGVQALVCAAFVLAFALSLTAQTVHKPTSLRIISADLNPAEHTCALTLLNTSSQPVTALRVSIQYKDGGVLTIGDGGAFAGPPPKPDWQGILRPGALFSKTVSVDNDAKDCHSVWVSAVMYKDGTAEGDRASDLFAAYKAAADSLRAAASSLEQIDITNPAKARAELQAKQGKPDGYGYVNNMAFDNALDFVSVLETQHPLQAKEALQKHVAELRSWADYNAAMAAKGGVR